MIASFTVNKEDKNLCDISQGHSFFPKEDALWAKSEISIPKLAFFLRKKNWINLIQRHMYDPVKDFDGALLQK